jgi:hypothetical protein
MSHCLPHRHYTKPLIQSHTYFRNLSDPSTPSAVGTFAPQLPRPRRRGCRCPRHRARRQRRRRATQGADGPGRKRQRHGATKWGYGWTLMLNDVKCFVTG